MVNQRQSLKSRSSATPSDFTRRQRTIQSQNTIVLNEFSTRASDGYCGGSGNFVEIANAGAVSVDISGYGIAEKDADFDDDKLYASLVQPSGWCKNHNLCENDTHDGLDFGLSLEEGVTLYDSNGFVIDTFFASDHSQHVMDGASREFRTSSVAWRWPLQAHRISLTLFNRFYLNHLMKYQSCLVRLRNTAASTFGLWNASFFLSNEI